MQLLLEGINMVLKLLLVPLRKTRVAIAGMFQKKKPYNHRVVCQTALIFWCDIVVLFQCVIICEGIFVILVNDETLSFLGLEIETNQKDMETAHLMPQGSSFVYVTPHQKKPRKYPINILQAVDKFRAAKKQGNSLLHDG